MNQKLELSIEAALDNRTYRLSLPMGAPFAHIFQVLDSLKVEVETMKTNQQKLQDDQAQQQTT